MFFIASLKLTFTVINVSYCFLSPSFAATAQRGTLRNFPNLTLGTSPLATTAYA